jgi:hypothetical protein
MTRIKNFTSKIIAGISDAVFPNIKESVKLTESQFVEEKPSYKIDYIRLITSLITFGLLIASAFNWIDLKEIIKIISIFELG